MGDKGAKSDVTASLGQHDLSQDIATVGGARTPEFRQYGWNAADETDCFTAIVASSDDAIVSVSAADGRIMTWNPAAERLFGYTREEISGASFTILTPDNVGVAHVTAFQRAIKDGSAKYASLKRHKDGRLIEVSVTAERIQRSDGRIIGVFGIFRDETKYNQTARALAERTRVLSTLNRTGTLLAAELKLEKLIQTATDACVEISGAEFGAFFYNSVDDKGEHHTLYAISGVDRAQFEKFPLPRATEVLHPVFHNVAIVRSDDITQDSRYGKSAPFYGMPQGHLPVRSYLGVPVASAGGEMFGGFLFGHQNIGVFTEEHEQILKGIAAQTAIALDNARLYQDAQRELDHRRKITDALRISEERFRVLTDVMPQFVWMANAQGHVDYFNERWYDYTGAIISTTDGHAWLDFVHPDDVRVAKESWMTSVSSGVDYEIEYRLRRHDGLYRWFLTRALPMRDENGDLVRWFGSCTDIDDQKMEGQAHQILTRELSHRVKNLFAVALGMVTLTARNSNSVQDMAKTLSGRIGALAKAHDLVRWTLRPDTEKSQDTFLNELIPLLMAPYSVKNNEQRVKIVGPPQRIGSLASTNLALVLHELTTNAVKYGALSVPSGQLNVTWEIKHDTLHIHWKEQDGPPVIKPDKTQGFGMQLARMSVNGQLGGEYALKWLPTGVEVDISIPMEQIYR